MAVNLNQPCAHVHAGADAEYVWMLSVVQVDPDDLDQLRLASIMQNLMVSVQERSQSSLLLHFFKFTNGDFGDI